MTAPSGENKPAPAAQTKEDLVNENETLRQTIESLQEANRGLVANYVEDTAMLTTGIKSRGLTEAETFTKAQATRDFSFAGLRGPNRRIMLASGFTVSAGDIVSIGDLALNRIAKDHPDVFETDEKKWGDQVHTTRVYDRKTGRWDAKKETVKVSDLKKRMRTIGKLTVR